MTILATDDFFRFTRQSATVLIEDSNSMYLCVLSYLSHELVLAYNYYIPVLLHAGFLGCSIINYFKRSHSK